MTSPLFIDLVFSTIQSFLSVRDKLRLICCDKFLYENFLDLIEPSEDFVLEKPRPLDHEVTFDKKIDQKYPITFYKKIKKFIIYTEEQLEEIYRNVGRENITSLAFCPEPVVNKFDKFMLLNYTKPFDIPPNLRALKLGYYFNGKLLNMPSTLTVLELGKEFLKDLTLPDGLKTLIVNGVIPFCDYPSTLTEIIFSDHYNLPIRNIPLTVTDMAIGCCYSQPLNDVKFPDSLKRLTLRVSYCYTVPHFSKVKLPSGLEELNVSKLWDIDYLKRHFIIPESLKTIRFKKIEFVSKKFL